MGFLESVGVFAILFVGLILVLQNLSSKEHEEVKPNRIHLPENKGISKPSDHVKNETIYEKVDQIKNRMLLKYGRIPESVEFRKLIPYSSKCQKRINENSFLSFDDPKRKSIDILQRELKGILKEPTEFWTATEKYYDALDRAEILRQTKIQQTELFIKYNEIIFRVFNHNKYLSKNVILSRLLSLLKLEKEEAKKILEQWLQFNLIENPIKDDGRVIDTKLYEICFSLEYAVYDSQFKIARQDWLIKNNIELIDPH